MSRSYDRRDTYDRRDSRRDRDRRSPPSSSRRSPSPPPRDDNDLPQSFGRIPESSSKDDDKDVLHRMRSSFVSVPLGSLAKCLDKKDRKIKVWTRNFKEVRGICTGYIVAFDKHWNLVMKDVDEVFLKPRKAKTPFLNSVASAENFPELPKKTPKKKKDKDAATQEKDPNPPPPKEEATEGGKPEKKRRRRRRKKGPHTEKRFIDQLFVRGDNIVMIAILDADDEQDKN